MRRVVAIPFEDSWLLATFDGPATATRGWVFVIGGSQTRVGPHRLYERLAARLAGQGEAVIRFDRRGVGDTPGVDRGYRASAPEIAAAAAALRGAFPAVGTVSGFGLCDGATALAFHGRAAGIEGLVIANPWVVEPTGDLPPAAAIRGHYARRLFDPAAWAKLMNGGVDLRRLARSVARSAGRDDMALVHRLAEARPSLVVLAEGDGTAQAFAAAWRRLGRPASAVAIVRIPTASHSFGDPAAFEALTQALLGYSAATASSPSKSISAR